MKKYITEIVLICFFLIANVGIYLYFDNEINSVKAGQLVAKMEAEEKAKVEADKKKEQAEKDKALAEKKAEEAKAEAEKAQAEVERVKAEAERKDAEKKEKEEKERKKREEKEQNERLGIHKYKVVKSAYINWESANDEAIGYAEEKGFSKSYLLHIDSPQEWKIVKKELEKKLENYKFWYFIGGKYDYSYSNYIWVDEGGFAGQIDNDVANKLWFNNEESQHVGYVGDESEDYIKLQYIGRGERKGWRWLDVTNTNSYEDTNAGEIKPMAPDNGAYIIEYEE